MALESFCLQHRPAAASEGQAESRGGPLGKAKPTPKKRHPWRSLSCPLRLRLPANSRISRIPPRACPSLLGLRLR